MKILKVINNNVVSCTDETGRETVAMGRGLGFGVRPGMPLPEEKVEKRFRLETKGETERLKSLFASISEERIELCSRIISYAAEQVGKSLNPSLYLTLTDHVNFAISRMHQGITFHNALLTEVRIFYPSEFAVGKYATALIKEELGVSLPEDEAASIALHLVNAEIDDSLGEIVHMTQALHGILERLRKDPSISLQEDSIYFDEFTIHLKFLVMRAFHGEVERRQEPEFIEVIRAADPREYACASRIAQYLREESGHRVSDESIAYLAVNLRRVNTNYIKKEGTQ